MTIGIDTFETGIAAVIIARMPVTKYYEMLAL